MVPQSTRPLRVSLPLHGVSSPSTPKSWTQLWTFGCDRRLKDFYDDDNGNGVSLDTTRLILGACDVKLRPLWSWLWRFRVTVATSTVSGINDWSHDDDNHRDGHRLFFRKKEDIRSEGDRSPDVMSPSVPSYVPRPWSSVIRWEKVWSRNETEKSHMTGLSLQCIVTGPSGRGSDSSLVQMIESRL